jgi:hypothetical protein
MMHFRGFKSKKELKERIAKSGTEVAGPHGVITIPYLVAGDYFIETSFFGSELKENGTFCVCMDHPKRTKFANVTVKNNLIVGVK